MDKTLLFVGFGGAAGAMTRVALTRILPGFALGVPLKILCINVLGCLAIGILTELMAFYWSASTNMRHFLIQGFLAGFTTFSSFALEFGVLFEKGSHFVAIIYALMSVVLSLTSFFFGLKIIRLFVSF